MDLSIIAIIISIIAVLISLYFGLKQKQHSEAQHKIATEPDFRLHIDMPNAEPVGVNCRNWGSRVTDMKVSIGEQSQELTPHPHELFDEYFFKIPKGLFEGKSVLAITLSFRDKLKKLRDKRFIYEPKNKSILPE